LYGQARKIIQPKTSVAQQYHGVPKFGLPVDPLSAGIGAEEALLLTIPWPRLADKSKYRYFNCA